MTPTAFARTRQTSKMIENFSRRYGKAISIRADCPFPERIRPDNWSTDWIDDFLGFTFSNVDFSLITNSWTVSNYLTKLKNIGCWKKGGKLSLACKIDTKLLKELAPKSLTYHISDVEDLPSAIDEVTLTETHVINDWAKFKEVRRVKFKTFQSSELFTSLRNALEDWRAGLPTQLKVIETCGLQMGFPYIRTHDIQLLFSMFLPDEMLTSLVWKTKKREKKKVNMARFSSRDGRQIRVEIVEYPEKNYCCGLMWLHIELHF